MLYYSKHSFTIASFLAMLIAKSEALLQKDITAMFMEESLIVISNLAQNGTE
jgi:hypothetical protein